MVETIRFRVVKEPYGWAVRLGDAMMTPFQSQPSAIRHASGIVEALRQRGEIAEVVVEESSIDHDGAGGRSWAFLRTTADVRRN